MTETTVRKAQVGDLEVVCRLLRDADLCYEDVALHLVSGFVVAESGERIVGVAGLEICDQFGFLRSVVVESEHRNSGIATVLVRDRLSFAQSERLRAVYLLSLTAERYFARIGFTTVSRDAVPDPIRQTEEFSRFCPQDAVVMAMPLDLPHR